jgi:hypothetical protein
MEGWSCPDSLPTFLILAQPDKRRKENDCDDQQQDEQYGKSNTLHTTDSTHRTHTCGSPWHSNGGMTRTSRECVYFLGFFTVSGINVPTFSNSETTKNLSLFLSRVLKVPSKSGGDGALSLFFLVVFGFGK